MKKVILILTLVVTLLFAFSALAADKVVIIPLNSNPKGCPAGLTDCTGNCVDILNNPSYCGACTTPCTTDEYCDNGTCTSKYSIPNCDDGNACTDDSYDFQSQSCVYTNNASPCNDENLCTLNDTCSAGTCQGNPKICNDGYVCTGVNGTCVCAAEGVACVSSFPDCCNSGCADLQTDPLNCGLCGKVCGGDSTCVAGVCAYTCEPECTDGSLPGCCSTGCTDLSTDGANCGACDVVCPNGLCLGGTCI